jgi:subtilisin family serine protease
MKKIVLALIFAVATSISYSQKATLNWYNKSPKGDKTYGTGAEKAYKLLEGKVPQEVIVAVIDSGVEVDHEDLKNVLWVNKGEIPGNGIDDDGNGYIDDVHGWSFLGGATEDINHEAMEIARMYRLEKKYFDGKDVKQLSAADAERYKKFEQLKADFNEEQDALMQQYQGINMLSEYIGRVKAASNGVFSKKTNKAFKPTDPMDIRIQKRMKMILVVAGAEELDSQITQGADQIGGLIKYNLMDADSLRRAVVGDDPYDLTDKFYGCNRYEGPDAMHGTHVSGIIAAERGNGIGIDGVASNAKIMVLRAVPNGDERDKDVANGIRYAVDNGANIINMSFGKGYKWDKDVVNEAVLYAQDHNVLLVHAAGNSSQDNDVTPNYPNDSLGGGMVANNWIEVGASQPLKKKLATDFSNYGQNNVDVFAPGQSIYSTIPNNGYAYFNGTSMASPVCAGVCALVWSRNPSLTAKDVKMIMEASVVLVPGKVVLPGTKKTKVAFPTLSRTGGLINAERALNMATLPCGL